MDGGKCFVNVGVYLVQEDFLRDNGLLQLFLQPVFGKRGKIGPVLHWVKSAD